MGPSARYVATSLAIIPFLVLVIGILLLDQMYPIYINSNTGLGQDPAYQYLFAGVDILQGHSPTHTDHPGTPLQTLIAVVIAIVYFFLRSFELTDLGLFDTVLHRPELFLIATSCVLLALTVTALFYFGRHIYLGTKNLTIAVACQLTPLLYAVVIPNLVFPTPEALLISISLMLMGVLTPIVFGKVALNPSTEKFAVRWAGIFCGLGLATKLTFMPMLSLLLLFRDPLLILRASLVCLFAWCVGVLPIWPRLAGMFQWFYSLLTHSGIHGRGSNEIFNLEHIKTALAWLFTHYKLFYGVTLCLLFLFFLALFMRILRWSPARRFSLQVRCKLTNASARIIHRGELLTVGVFCGVLIGQTLMVAKHLGSTYMIPALPLPVLAFAWLIHSQNIIVISKTIKKILAISWLTTLVSTSAVAVTSSIATVSFTHQKGLESHAVIQEQLKQFENPLLMGAFNCNLAECALWFGMALVPEMELRMASITPNFYYFDIFSKKLHLPGRGELTDQETRETILIITKQPRPVLLISPPFPHLNKLKLELIVSTPIQNLYRVLGPSN